MYCRLPAELLSAFASACFRQVGMPAADAGVAAEALVRADLRGVDTHGVNRLPEYVRALAAGRINPRPEVKVIREAGAALHVDGDGGLGHVVSTRAMELCLARASEQGAAFAGVRNSRHNGAASLYALMAAEREMIGLSLTGGGVRVAPAGGREAMLGTNPIAFAAPVAGEPPLVVDMATSVVAGGKVEQYELQGKPIPPGWALDEAGAPTTDAAAANRGALLPLGSSLLLGSYKGYALSLIVETLCNLLTGAATGPERARRTGPAGGGTGHFCGALRIDHFQPVEEFKERLAANLRLLRTSAPQEGCERIYTPGELEAACERERRAEGIRVYEKTRAALVALGEELGVSFHSP
jgi:LDH2 family malate/lactate/ureidoglycolate dehydrogenase